jgi:hypothetical protein
VSSLAPVAESEDVAAPGDSEEAAAEPVEQPSE